MSFYALPPLTDLFPPVAATSPAADPAVRAPLCSVKLHRRWIADVQWVTDAGRPLTADASARLLLSASDDGSLVLTRCNVGGGDDDAGVTVVPVARLDGSLHHAGLYAMHEVGGAIATSSKDGSVAISTLHPTAGLAVVRRYPDAGQVR